MFFWDNLTYWGSKMANISLSLLHGHTSLVPRPYTQKNGTLKKLGIGPGDEALVTLGIYDKSGRVSILLQCSA